MIENDKGIVLHCTNYSESSLISHIYTQTYGIQSYIMNNVRSNRSKMAYFRPLSLVQIQFYNKKNVGLHRLKEISYSTITNDIYENIYKSSISIFVSEFLNKLCTNSEPNIEFYQFIEDFIIQLQNSKENFAYNHIQFLIETTHFWGIFPHNNYSHELPYFDISKGMFVSTYSNQTCRIELSKILSDLFKNDYTKTQLTRTEKREILDILLQYFSLHVHKIDLSNTLQVLETIFD
jgi:DNA repair protein RecO (recombination protein O)